MTEKTYPIMYKDQVVGRVILTDIDFRDNDELVPVITDDGQLEGFEVPVYAD